MKDLNPKQRFIIFCLESYKKEKSITGKTALNEFLKHDVFKYLEMGYDVLHTQSMHYVCSEITNYIKQQG